MGLCIPDDIDSGDDGNIDVYFMPYLMILSSYRSSVDIIVSTWYILWNSSTDVDKSKKSKDHTIIQREK